MQQLAPGPSLRGCPEHGLVSLWDMIRIQLEHFVTIGNNVEKCRSFIAGAAASHNGKPLPPMAAVAAVLIQLKDACAELGLTTSVATLDRVVPSLKDYSQIEVLLDVVRSEMATRLFLHVPAERAKLWETADLLREATRAAFPSAAQEVRASGTAYACGLWNASVFHSMRAAEDGLVAICDELGIERNGAEQWGNLIERIEKKLVEIAKLPKASEEKRDNLQPLSELVIDLRLFKDAWRNQNSHTIVAYNDGNAHAIIYAVCRVLDALAYRGGVAARKPA